MKLNGQLPTWKFVALTLVLYFVLVGVWLRCSPALAHEPDTRSVCLDQCEKAHCNCTAKCNDLSDYGPCQVRCDERRDQCKSNCNSTRV